MRKRLSALLLLVPIASFSSVSWKQLTQSEKTDADKTIHDIYEPSLLQEDSVMNQRVRKWRRHGVSVVERMPGQSPLRFQKSDPRAKVAEKDPLLKQAQIKGTEEYQKIYCEQVLKKQDPTLSCDGPQGRAPVQANDRVASLVSGWVKNENDIVRNLLELKNSGDSELPLWSDDYWRIRWGGTSFRYSKSNPSPAHWEAVIGLYQQPAQFNDLGENPEAAIDRWSPSEKYDLLVGDLSFTLTKEEKDEGSGMTSGQPPNRDVEDWMGKCHGWAAASIRVAKPVRGIKTFKGANDLTVVFRPADVRSLSTLQWASGSSRSNFVGGRCNSKNPKRHPNGRLIQQECFDNNPATFHLVAGNMIGEVKGSFVIDKTFDYEVWNQPVKSYHFTYLNPVTGFRSEDFKKDAEKLMVDMNDPEFVKKDRFRQEGMSTRNLEADKVVGVIATIEYLVEYRPQWDPRNIHAVSEEEIERATYTYDLELDVKSNRRGTVVEPIGGEWHQNAHPDFIWVPQKGSHPSHVADRGISSFDGEAGPTSRLTAAARNASRSNYPLRSVVDALVEAASN